LRDSVGTVREDTRAISSVIGVTLLLGATVMLALVVVPTVLSLGDEVETTPAAEFAFKYTEDVEPETTDSFGTPGTVQGADGLLTITFEDGERIAPEHLSVGGSVSGGLVSDTRPEAEINETIGPGNTLTVWVSRGDTVEVIWNAADGKKAEILSSFEVQPGDGPPPGVPTSDTGCSYIESQTPGDVTIDGVIVVCDLSQYNIGDIDIVNDGAVVGVVEGDGDIDADSGFGYIGPVTSGTDGDGDLDLSGSTLNSDVDANGDLTLDSASRINGDVDSSGDADIDSQSTVNGDLKGGGDVDVDSRSRVDGDIISDVTGDGDVSISGTSFVGENITTGGSVDVDSGSTIGGPIAAAGSIDVSDGSSVSGRLDNSNGSDNDISVSNSRTAGGIVATGDTDIDGTSTIGGPVTSDGDFDSTDSDILGEIDAGGDTTIQSSSISGGVEAGGDTDIDGNSTVRGSVIGEGSVDLEQNVTVEGDIDNTASSGSDVTIGGSTVDGSVAAAGNLSVSPGSKIGGAVNTDNEFAVSNVEIGGEIDTGDDVTVQSSTVGGIDSDAQLDLSGSTVDGTAIASGESEIETTTVDGDVVVNDDLDLEDSTIQGHAFVGGSFSCDNSTINGQSCSAYTSPDSRFNVTITGTDSPVDEGNQLRVTVEVRNNGPSDDSRRVALDIDGTERDDTTVSVGNRTATTETLTWNTNDGDNGSYTATVHTDESHDNNDSTPVKVNTTVAPPNIDRFDTAQRPGGKSGIDVNWNVSAGAAELDTVEIEVYDQNGVLTGGSMTNVSGASASGSERFEPLADGKDHEVVLTVTDVDGESKTQSKTQTAG